MIFIFYLLAVVIFPASIMCNARFILCPLLILCFVIILIIIIIIIIIIINIYIAQISCEYDQMRVTKKHANKLTS